MRLTPISSTIIIAAKLRFIAGSICMKLVSCYAAEAPQWIVIHRDAPWSRADGGSRESSRNLSPIRSIAAVPTVSHARCSA
jgi:hypothetical protein